MEDKLRIVFLVAAVLRNGLLIASYGSFVIKQTLMRLINFCGKNLSLH
jgi:hypothetical protein